MSAGQSGKVGDGEQVSVRVDEGLASDDLSNFINSLIMSLNEILADPGLSNWLKDAIKTAYERDPVDALHDVRRLLKMLGERYTQIVNRDRP